MKSNVGLNLSFLTKYKLYRRGFDFRFVVIFMAIGFIGIVQSRYFKPFPDNKLLSQPQSVFLTGVVYVKQKKGELIKFLTAEQLKVLNDSIQAGAKNRYRHAKASFDIHPDSSRYCNVVINLINNPFSKVQLSGLVELDFNKGINHVSLRSFSFGDKYVISSRHANERMDQVIMLPLDFLLEIAGISKDDC
ncbi:hypothetical protein [Motilimonas sp. KMU-193]|uniref:hypothetical protein n=1 Tax=Motilimonas sp. KMU-193 TaxID=3388668 RepID=UPI00396B0A21